MGCLEVHDSLDVETDNVSEKLESEEKRAIYIGNLPHSIEEATLSKIFSLSGNIHSIKLVGKSAIKNAANLYAFVEYDDPASAENAIETFNGTLNFIYWGTTYLTHLGRTVFDTPMKVNWAYQSSTSATAREETSSHFTIFVGDLATEVDDETLREAFSAYESLSDARIMWDMTTGRSRGYGFVSFVERSDAEAALEEMPGRWLGSRCIRCNWANQKQTMPTTPIEVLATGPASQKLDVAQQFAIVGLQAHYTVTTIYVGNLAIDTDMSDLKPLFDAYGGAIEIKMHCNRGFAFVRLSSHEWATSAIIQLQGVIVKGRPIKCSCEFRIFLTI